MQAGFATRNLLRKAHTAHQGGRLTETESGYRSVLRIRPDDPDALHFLGMLHFQRGERTHAIELVRRSLSALGSNPHAWNNLGNMLLASNEAQAASEAYEKATEFGGLIAEGWRPGASRSAAMLRQFEATQRIRDQYFRLGGHHRSHQYSQSVPEGGAATVPLRRLDTGRSRWK